MSTYTLSGTGLQPLSANVGALHIHVTTIPSNAGIGVANPANYYGIAMIRAGDGTGWFPAKPVDAVDTWMGLPVGVTEVGYAFLDGAVATVTEVFGASPLGGATPSLEQLTDVAVSSVANNDVLTWDTTTSRWKNKPVAAGSTSLSYSSATMPTDVAATTAGTWYDAVSLTLTAGTYLVVGKMIGVPTAVTLFESRIFDGSASADAAECFCPTTNQNYTLNTFAIIVLSATTTIKLQGTFNNSSIGTIKAASATGNTVPSISGVTRLAAVKIA